MIFIMQTLPAMLRFLFFPCINYSFNVFYPSSPVLFNLRSTLICHRQNTHQEFWVSSPIQIRKRCQCSFVYYRATLPLISSDLFPGLRMWKTQPKFQVPVAYPVHLLKATLNHLHILQFLWYFPRGRFLLSNNLILLCSHNVVFLLPAVLPQEQRLVVKKGSPDVLQPLQQNTRIINRSRQHSFWRPP